MHSPEFRPGVGAALSGARARRRGQSHTYHTSKWLNIWIRDVFCSQHLWCRVPTVLTKTRLELSIKRLKPHCIYDTAFVFMILLLFRRCVAPPFAATTTPSFSTHSRLASNIFVPPRPTCTAPTTNKSLATLFLSLSLSLARSLSLSHCIARCMGHLC